MRVSLSFVKALGLGVMLMFSASAQAQERPTTAGETATTYTLKYVDRWLPAKVQRERSTTAPTDMIMLHFCSDCVQNPENPYNVDRIVEIFTSYTVSAHYLIGREGTVFRFVPEDKVAFHAGRGRLAWMPDRTNNLNQHAFGIEMLNVSAWEDMQVFMSKEKYDAFASKHPDWIGYTDAQYAALNALIADIRKRHPEIPFDRKHIVGHSEYAGAGRRTDPGVLFDYGRIGLPKTQ